MVLTEKQNNCPYCKGMKRVRDDFVYQHSRKILAIQGNSLTYTLVLANGTKTPDRYEVQTWISYCPKCGRKLV